MHVKLITFYFTQNTFNGHVSDIELSLSIEITRVLDYFTAMIQIGTTKWVLRNVIV